MDFFQHNLLHPLKSLGRLVSDSLQGGRGGGGGREEEEIHLSIFRKQSSPLLFLIPHLRFLHAEISGRIGVLLISARSKLFMVLYGYSGGPERSGGHAISGLTLPEKTVPGSHHPPLNKDTLDLPEGLNLVQASWGDVSHCGVFTDTNNIPKGTRFGPFRGKLVNTSEIKTYDDNTLMWR
ncbi:hypothetical protein KUCAC02_035077 [Chaenocephalus aceratus]|nr:hypothetical protein KUCAC02_035077 [Chaenocephalus aceratus]